MNLFMDHLARYGLVQSSQFGAFSHSLGRLEAKQTRRLPQRQRLGALRQCRTGPVPRLFHDDVGGEAYTGASEQ